MSCRETFVSDICHGYQFSCELSRKDTSLNPVAAVPNGLKAWELLKGRPHNVDLRLIEVYLLSIFGYALLSLIMEHEICKNICRKV
ncbi:hypothetical protein VNO77_42380 [Canavalia gladiata]|uniref:Uncharacterized protein n=1 Tax=Canavalia gladiata TaxID=3824 RepID=A0AAN9K3Y6_CANGL